ncbi:glycosyltransferase family 39 protein [uncultured Pseudoramibacter sp.]|uniref:glycosyltransferase family 39 protein n=1 Tax=uncultured Pseudoramibacter sp. TaxID=1623493 RepID=UPI0025FA16AD|nr:glycosyltransferase family 39 protein [uncultured Pseudoramibacter sp.]
MKKNIKKYLQDNKNTFFVLFFCLIIVVQIIAVVHFAIQKDGFFGDENYSFNLANSYYSPFVGHVSKSNINKVLNSKFWITRVNVTNNHRFIYRSVFYNQSKDVHPPFYYVVLHTICSIFVSPSLNKWQGIILNIIFFVITQIFLAKTSNKVFSNRWMTAAVLIFFGFSWGNINNVLFIRMYAMLTMWGIISFYLHLVLLEKKTIKNLILILLVGYCGILTQYYFIFFQFFLSLCTVVYLIIDSKSTKLCLEYILGYILVLGLSVITFPAMIPQMLGKTGTQGISNFQKATRLEYWLKIKDYINIIKFDLFGNRLKVTFLIILGLLLINLLIIVREKHKKSKLFINKKNNIQNLDLRIGYFAIIASIIIIIGVFAIVIKSSLYIATRYLVILYPIASLVFVYIFMSLWNKIIYTPKISFVILFLIVLLFCKNTYNIENTFLYNRNYPRVSELIQKNKQDMTLVIYEGNSGSADWWCSVNHLQYLTQAKYSCIYSGNTKGLDTVISGDRTQKLLICFHNGEDEESISNIIKEVKRQNGYNHDSLIDDYCGQKLYYLEK